MVFAPIQNNQMSCLLPQGQADRIASSDVSRKSSSVLPLWLSTYLDTISAISAKLVAGGTHTSRQSASPRRRLGTEPGNVSHRRRRFA